MSINHYYSVHIRMGAHTHRQKVIPIRKQVCLEVQSSKKGRVEVQSNKKTTLTLSRVQLYIQKSVGKDLHRKD